MPKFDPWQTVGWKNMGTDLENVEVIQFAVLLYILKDFTGCEIPPNMVVC